MHSVGSSTTLALRACAQSARGPASHAGISSAPGPTTMNGENSLFFNDNLYIFDNLFDYLWPSAGSSTTLALRACAQPALGRASHGGISSAHSGAELHDVRNILKLHESQMRSRHLKIRLGQPRPPIVVFRDDFRANSIEERCDGSLR